LSASFVSRLRLRVLVRGRLRPLNSPGPSGTGFGALDGAAELAGRLTADDRAAGPDRDVGEHERGRLSVLRHTAGAFAGQVDSAGGVAVLLERGLAEEEVGT